MIKELLRVELYNLIWVKPLKEVGEILELPVITLKKICKDYLIPLPKKGHWTKIAFGKEVERTQLEKVDYPNDQAIDVQKYVVEHENSFSYKLEKRIKEIEQQSANFIQVPKRLINPDPLIVRAKTYFSKQTGRKYKGFEDVILSRSEHLSISVRKQNVPRALRIMDTLIKLFHRRGHKIHLEHWSTILTIKEQKFEIKFREKCNRVKVREGTWNTTDLVPNNLLSLKYAKPYSSTEWADTNSQSLEKQVVKIVASFELMAEKEIQDQKEREIYWAEQERKEAIMKENQARKNWEDNKSEILMKHLDLWKIYKERKQAFNSLVEELETSSSIKSQEWKMWAELEIEKTNPLKNGIEHLIKQYDYKSDSK